MNATDEVIFWLVPCPQDAARFSHLIEALAKPRGAAIFQPHLTLGAVRGGMPDVSPIVSALTGLELLPLEIAETDSFTMSLFVRFRPSAKLMAGRTALENLPGFRPGRDFDPHISLCYGAPTTRDVFEDQLQALLQRPIVFNQLVAMHVPLPVETQDDIRKWRQITSFTIPQCA